MAFPEADALEKASCTLHNATKPSGALRPALRKQVCAVVVLKILQAPIKIGQGSQVEPNIVQ